MSYLPLFIIKTILYSLWFFSMMFLQVVVSLVAAVLRLFPAGRQFLKEKEGTQ